MINSHGSLDCNVEFYRPSDSTQIRKVSKILTVYSKFKKKLHSITDDEKVR